MSMGCTAWRLGKSLHDPVTSNHLTDDAVFLPLLIPESVGPLSTQLRFYGTIETVSAATDMEGHIIQTAELILQSAAN